MRINFVTLFDYNYIERGLTLYYSLISVCNNFTLYVICFDNKCYMNLYNLHLENLVLINYSDFEDDLLRIAKSNRNKREYFWTCSSFGIKYVLENYNLDHLTYIDSDLFFYSDPSSVINSFLQSGNDVAIISHRYSNHYENKYFSKKYGKYCVEFNSFKNTKNGLDILNWWCQKCYESCPEKPRKGAFGDQKYLELFEVKFSGVLIYNDFGLGIAPWNIDDYKYISNNIIENKNDKTSGTIIFYHFHSMFLFDKFANINIYIRPGKKDEMLVKYLYDNYIFEINKSLSILNKHVNKPATTKVSVFIGILSYMFSERNLIIAFSKLYRLVLYRKKDIFSLLNLE